jgi:hypothetical protein
MIDLNPLEILREREVKTLPPHFSKVKISNNDRYDKNILNWIRTKLSGRYCIVSYPAVDSDDKFKASTYVGFEEQKELTYFMLACQYLRRN